MHLRSNASGLTNLSLKAKIKENHTGNNRENNRENNRGNNNGKHTTKINVQGSVHQTKESRIKTLHWIFSYVMLFIN